MLFKNTPDALDRVVFAVIRWVIGQLKRQDGTICQIGQACHELRAARMVFGTIVEVEQQRCNLREGVVVVIPEMLDTIDHEIGGHVRRADIK